MARRRSWADFFLQLTLADGVPQCKDLLTQAPDLDTITVARLIAGLTVSPESFTAQVDGRMIIDIGVGVASQEAFAVAGCLGLPIVSAGADSPPRGWLYRGQISCEKVHSTGTTYEIMKRGQVNFDIGAMRKVDKGVLFFIAEANVLGGSAYNVVLTGLVRSMILT